jgi:biotin carboxylase
MGRAGAGNDRRPRLGVLYCSASVELPSLVRATRRSWPTLWIVDEQRLHEPGQVDQLRRLGDVVDISGLAPREIAGVLAERVDGLLATNDTDLVLAAELAAELGLTTIDTRAVHRLTDKSAQRQALRAAGLPVPGVVAVRSDADAAAIASATRELRFPAVLKPARGSGSRATWYVDSAASVSGLLAARSRLPVEEFVVEERIPDGWGPDESPWADYVSIESFVHRGRIEHFGITGRSPLADGLRETGAIMPAELPSGTAGQLLALAEDAIAALDVRHGVLHTEVKLSPLGPRVIEVNGRLGGGSIRWLAERVTGTSLLAAAARVNLGLPPHVAGARFDGVGFSYYFQPPLDAREVRSIDGTTEAYALPGVEEVIVLHPVGDRLDPTEQGSLSAVLLVRGWRPTHDAVAEVIRRLREVLTVGYR